MNENFYEDLKRVDQKKYFLKKGLSIIVPIYNTPIELLKECLTNLNNLEFNFNCEFILINDGSTIPIESVISPYIKKDSRFRYFEQKNMGVSSARNKGIKESRFSKCLFLDPDDYIIQNDSSADIQLLDEVDLYFFPYRKISHGALFPEEDVFENNNLLSTENLIKSQLHLDDEIYKGINCFFASTCWGKIYSCKFLKEGVLFDSKISKREDVLFTLEYYKLCKRYQYLPELSYVYRVNRPDSLSYRFDNGLWNNYQKVFIRLVELLNERYSEDLRMYSLNLFHEGLLLDLLNAQSTRSIKNKINNMHHFISLVNSKIPSKNLPSLDKLSLQKKLLYRLINKDKMIFVFSMLKLKKLVKKDKTS